MNDQLPANIPPPDSDAIASMLERLATSNVDPAVLAQVWAIRKDYMAEVRQDRRERAKIAFNTDMAEVQATIGAINRSGKNPTFTSPYAKLEDLDRAARPIYTQFGFSIRYVSWLADNAGIPPPRDGWLRVVLIISHTGGHYEEHHLDGPIGREGGRGLTRTPMQEVGAADTYLRRYLLQRTLNLVPAGAPWDNDGEGQRGQPHDPRDQTPHRPGKTPEAWIAELCGEIDKGLTLPDKADILKARIETMTPGQREAFRNHPAWLAWMDKQFPIDAEQFRAMLDPSPDAQQRMMDNYDRGRAAERRESGE